MFGKFKAEQVNPWFGALSTERPIYKPFFNGEELATKEQLDELNKKLKLILDHLKLEYVPESEKKEPAKLVPKIDLSHISVGSSAEWSQFDCIKSIQDYADSMYEPPELKKKKRGRPKKK